MRIDTLLEQLHEPHMHAAAWLAGGISAISAAVFVWALHDFRSAQQNASFLDHLPHIQATTQPLPEQRVRAIALQVKDANPDVQVTPMPDSIIIAVPDEHGHARWQQAVFGVIKAAPDAVWRIRRLCAGECGAAKAGFTVELLAETKAVVFQ